MCGVTRKDLALKKILVASTIGPQLYDSCPVVQNGRCIEMKEAVIGVMMLLTLYAIYFTISLIWKGLRKGTKTIAEKVTKK